MKSLKKLSIIFIITLLVVSLIALAGCGNKTGDSTGGQSESSSGEKVYEWKLASIYQDPANVPDFNSLGHAQEKFAELVKEKTNGRVIITTYYNSVLGGNLELFEQIRNGELEVYFGQPMSSADPRFGVWSIPYLFENYEQVQKTVLDRNGVFFQSAHKWFKDDHNAELLAIGPSVYFRGFVNNKRTVKTVNDVKDMKVRIYQDPLVSIFWSGICNAQPIPGSEIYSALQTKAVDAMEFAPASVLAQRIDEVTKYFSDINWQWTSGANLLVSDKYWNELPDDLKEAVIEAAIEAMEFQGQQEVVDTEAAFKELEKRGLEVYRLTDEERQTWINYARSKDEEFKKFVGEDVFNEIINAVQSYK